MRDIQRKKIAPVAGTTTSPSPAVTVAAVLPIQAVRTISPTDSGEEQVISSNSSPLYRDSPSAGSNNDLVGENERLRKENVQLNKELSEMKSLCNNIYVMMSSYATNQPESSSQSTAAVKPLDLLPLMRFCDDPAVGSNNAEPEEEREQNAARLFGVSIGTKRVRESSGGGDEEMEQRRDVQFQQPPVVEVKSEPLDLES